MGLLRNESRVLMVPGTNPPGVLWYRVERDFCRRHYRVLYRYRGARDTLTLTDNDLYHAQTDGSVWRTLQDILVETVRHRHQEG